MYGLSSEPICLLLIVTMRLEVVHSKLKTGTKLFLQQPHNSIFAKWVAASGWQTSKVAATIVRSAEGRFS